MRVPRRLGWVAAVVALVSQLALGAMALPDDDAAAQVDALSIMCGGDAAPVHRHAAPCPLGVVLALPAVIPAADVGMPVPPGVVPMRIAVRPRVRAPPVVGVAAAWPRGPPSFA